MRVGALVFLLETARRYLLTANIRDKETLNFLLGSSKSPTQESVEGASRPDGPVEGRTIKSVVQISYDYNMVTSLLWTCYT